MTQELTSTRYRKLAKLLVVGKKVSLDSLTVEEQKFYSGVAPSSEAFGKFAEGILEGQLVIVDVETPSTAIAQSPILHNRVTLRFLKTCALNYRI